MARSCPGAASRAAATGGAAFRAFTGRAQALIGINSCMVAVAPYRSQSIAANGLHLVERGLLLSEARLLVYAAFLSSLASAPGAGAAAPQRLVAVNGLMAISPIYQKLLALLVHRIGEGRDIIGQSHGAILYLS